MEEWNKGKPLYHIMPISLRVRILADKLFVLPSAGFEPTWSIHCSTHSLRIMINHCDLWQVSGFLRVLQFPPPIKPTATI
jgi:hypothetical protein